MDLLPEPPIQPGARFDVVVYADARPARRSEESKAIVLAFPAGKAALRVSVRLANTDHFIVSGALIRELVISRDKERSTSARYSVRARPAAELAQVAGAPSIAAYFRYAGRSSGMVRRDVRIARFTPRLTSLRTSSQKPGKPKQVLAIDTGAAQPDLTVEILDPVKDGQHFECTVSSPHLKEFRKGKAGRWDLPSSTEDLVRGYFDKFTANPSSPRNTMRTLEGAGLELFDAAPALFKTAFWAMIDQQLPLHSIYIVSQEPYIPWELMVPNRPRPGGPRDDWDAPLGVKFALGRWIKEDFLSPRQRIPLSDGKTIAPNYRGGKKLKHVVEEVAFLSERFHIQTITPVTVDGIDADLSRGGASFLHFACHGSAGDDEDGNERMEIDLEGDGESLDSTRLRSMRGAKLACAGKKPLVFMNACEVGRQSIALIGVGGLAPTFLLIGASAVLAPLWSVKDEIAFEVAQQFYEATKQAPGTAFADILRQIRAKAYSNPYEDSWAAYIFYGDPLAAQADA